MDREWLKELIETHGDVEILISGERWVIFTWDQENLILHNQDTQEDRIYNGAEALIESLGDLSKIKFVDCA